MTVKIAEFHTAPALTVLENSGSKRIPKSPLETQPHDSYDLLEGFFLSLYKMTVNKAWWTLLLAAIWQLLVKMFSIYKRRTSLYPNQSWTHWHLQVRLSWFWLGCRLDLSIEVECFCGRGWEGIWRRCPTSGTSWWANTGGSDIVSQGLPRPEMALNGSTLLCLPSSLDWLKDWQANATALLAAGEARKNSGHYVYCDCTKVNGNRGLPFPSQQPLCVDSQRPDATWSSHWDSVKNADPEHSSSLWVLHKTES